ncbi:hypothetical protein TNIN_208431 [Trichonephila inaurata madagascariensis]|uniref:Uncharacterized protein n=1 Tax=Trichonephila inaurata madagascariensis TaxID=2747483 RepID=A0A8X6Y1N4_9ARAC|nr:hypothetical protein TNIN_208431 [Trichonephila inaurata madagascariensis]
MYVFGLIADGEIYFKACDLGHLLGYRNVSNVLGCHMETKKTVDHLLKNSRLKCPIPRRSRIVELSQVPSLLNRMTRPSESVENWFEKVQAGLLESRSNLEQVLKHPLLTSSAKKIPLFVVNEKNPEISLQKICKLLCLEKEIPDSTHGSILRKLLQS